MINLTQIDGIAAALYDVNGRSTEHTFTSASELLNLATVAEARLEALSIPKAKRAGTRVTAQSGEELPRAYKRSAITTTVTLVRRSTGWFLETVARSELYPRAKPASRLTLTAQQDAIAVANLRATYKVGA